MRTVKVEQVRDDVIGLRPVYTEMGNATEVILRSGELPVDERGLKSVLVALARAYAVDLKAQRQEISSLLNIRGTMPFYLGNQRIFIPLKMRKAVTKNDQVYGYVDVNFMTEPEAMADNRCRVRLINGIEIEIYSGIKTAAYSNYNGERLYEILATRNIKNSKEEQIIASVRLLINCFQNLQTSLQRIEGKMDNQVAEHPVDYD